LPLRFFFCSADRHFLFQKQKLESLHFAEFIDRSYLFLFTTLKKHYGGQNPINRSDFLPNSFVLLNHSTIIIEAAGF
jgi:hypothetical protein